MNVCVNLLDYGRFSVTNEAYLTEGLQWCDTFAGLQIPIITSTGTSGGLWNTGYNQVYIADTGTAIAALALCHSLQPDADKKAGYEDAMEKFKLFVTTGCNTPPDIGSAKVSVHTQDGSNNSALRKCSEELILTQHARLQAHAQAQA